MGLAEEELGQLFGDNTRTRHATEVGAHGTGLGLHVCRAILEAYGGRIWAGSEGVGQGTTFHAALPHGLIADRRQADTA
jgi:signal transduction histidine kinase